MKSFLIRWLVTTIAVLAAVKIIPGIRCDSWSTLIIASLVLGIFNAFIKPFLILLNLPIIVFTLGLFIPILNALLLWLTSALVSEFHVSGFWAAFFGSLVISIVSGVLNFFVRHEGRIRTITDKDTFRGEKVIDI